MSALEKALQSDELKQSVAVALGSGDDEFLEFERTWKALYEKLQHKRFVMPIMGTQGAGKSTILNALCYSKPVLPIDVEETTAIPVEIFFSTDIKQKARVYFKNGNIEECFLSEDALSAYVHQAHNPGNVKNVKYVSLPCNKEFLQNGLVLVDLPGLGSLTSANRETSLAYLAESTGVLYLARTIPPLTQSEAHDLLGVWVKAGSLFVYQNRWNTESNDEVEEGRDHNQKVLADLAKKAGLPQQSVPQVAVIDGHRALKACFTKDAEESKASNLDNLLAFLENLSETWPQKLRENIRSLVSQQLRIASARAREREQRLQEEVTHARQEIERNHAKHKHTLEKLEEAGHRSVHLLKEAQRKIETIGIEWKREERPNLRASMRNVLNRGITEAAQLERILADYTTDSLDRFIEKYTYILFDLQKNLSQLFSELNPDETRADVMPQTNGISGEQGSQYRNILPSVAGAVGPVAIAAYALLASNPAGWVVLAAGALVTSLFGVWVGRKSKEALLQQQIKKIEPSVLTAIDTFLDSTVIHINESFANIMQKNRESIDLLCQQKEKDLRDMYNKDITDLKRSPEEKQHLLQALSQALTVLGEWERSAVHA